MLSFLGFGRIKERWASESRKAGKAIGIVVACSLAFVAAAAFTAICAVLAVIGTAWSYVAEYRSRPTLAPAVASATKEVPPRTTAPTPLIDPPKLYDPPKRVWTPEQTSRYEQSVAATSAAPTPDPTGPPRRPSFTDLGVTDHDSASSHYGSPESVETGFADPSPDRLAPLVIPPRRNAMNAERHTGPRGGVYHYSKNGNKVYDRKK